MIPRLVACALLFTVTELVTMPRVEPVAAQGKDTKKDLNQLERQLKSVRAELAEANRDLAALRQENTQLRAAARKDAKSDAKYAKELQSTIDGYRNAGLIHVVVLKSKPETAAADVEKLIDESNSVLRRIGTVRGLWVGKPAAKPSSGAASDYNVALVLAFDDAAGLKSYYNDPTHLKFMDRHLKRWETPVVYDFEPRKTKP